MNFEIKHRSIGNVLFSVETESLKLAVELAVRSDANLAYANLTGAYLAYANLADANGKKIHLVGKRPLLVIGPLGSRSDRLSVFLTDAGVYVRAGCFWNTLEAFKEAVAATHGENPHGQEYRAVVSLIEAHARLWATVAQEVQP